MRSPTLGRLNRVLLLGCGITGSWVLPVLVRTCKMVHIYDDDTLDPSNPHGLWHKQAKLKVEGAIEPRFRDRCEAYARRITRVQDIRPSTYDLAVLCPDNAPARQLAGKIFREHLGKVKILDIRATPNTLVIWTVKGKKLWKPWMQSLEGYPTAMPCGHHDNVPMQAGAAAAHFAAWWLNSSMGENIWNIRYSFAEEFASR